MAIVTKTMEEIKREMTPERMRQISEALKYHIDEYDPENPPLTDEELKGFRPYKEVEYERLIIEKYRKNDPTLTEAERKKAEEVLEERARRRALRRGVKISA
ncbi:MAG: hypothetical protein IKN43_05505 [Selenomonadaceae bacterium]|nr:hypothetical protein [Selenomonadaceae bacterium]